MPKAFRTYINNCIKVCLNPDCLVNLLPWQRNYLKRKRKKRKASPSYLHAPVTIVLKASKIVKEDMFSHECISERRHLPQNIPPRFMPIIMTVMMMTLHIVIVVPPRASLTVWTKNKLGFKVSFARLFFL